MRALSHAATAFNLSEEPAATRDAYGRNIYSLSGAGYFPKWLSITHGTRKTPHVALITGAVIGYTVLIVLHLLGKGALVGATVINMSFNLTAPSSSGPRA